MYESASGGRRRLDPRVRSRQRYPLCDAHASPRELRARIGQAAREAAMGIGAQQFAGELFDAISDERMLKYALARLARDGGQAPGFDGETYDDLLRFDGGWSWVRQVRDYIRQDEPFRAAPLLEVSIPRRGKSPRTLHLPTVANRIIGRSILEAIGPLFDAQFDERSFGFRPGRGRDRALAHAINTATREDRWCWVTADIRNAFPSLPQQRATQVMHAKLRRQLGTCASIDGVMHIVNQLTIIPGQKGIPQGQSLSPLLLNIYLDELLDRRWRDRHADIPLIRVADDLLILANDQEEGRQALESLRLLLQPIGFQLKSSPGPTIANLANSEICDWLGFRIDKWRDTLTLRLTDSALEKLQDRLLDAHHKPESPVAAYNAVLGWMRQQGLAIPDEHLDRTLDQIHALGTELGFEEIPLRELLLSVRNESRERWESLLQYEAENVLVVRAGSADPHASFLPGGRAGRSRPAPLLGSFTIYTDGSTLGPQGPGGWAFLILDQHGQVVRADAGNAARATSNSMELMAVIEALSWIADEQTVLIRSDSQYVVANAQDNLRIWQAEGRLSRNTAHQSDLANVYPLTAFADQLNRLDCQFEHVRGHSGDLHNEWCDRWARAAALECEYHDSADEHRPEEI